MSIRKVRETGTFGRNEGHGLIRTITGNAWLYMEMPSQPSVRDASGWEQRVTAARPWYGIMQGLADLVPRTGLNSRKMLKGFYRRIHVVAVSSPRRFEPSPTLDEANRTRLLRENMNTTEHDRFTLIGVQLNAGGGEKGLKAIRDSMADAEGNIPDEAFLHDMERIKGILERAGCREASEQRIQRAFAWWPADAKPEKLPVMVEPGHMHVFPSYRACRLGAKYKQTRIDCETWGARIPGSYAMTLATLGVLPFKGEDERMMQRESAWAATLLASAEGNGGGAVCLSIRGLVEPGDLSREQVDKDKDKTLDKAYEQATGGHNANIKVAQELNTASMLYQQDGKPWPTLIEGNVTVAMPGVLENSTDVPYPGRLTLNPDRQHYAFEAMQIGSNVEYNPSPVYWPTPILAYAGINNIGFTGDDTGRGIDSDLPGALTGMSEADRQPIYDSPFYPSRRSAPPYTIILGSTGSGKALSQFSYLPVPPQKRFPAGGMVQLKDLCINDLLYSRDGKTYPIIGFSPVKTGDMYEMTLSDGQRIKCSGDHQWVAWTWKDRNFHRTKKHQKSLARRAQFKRIRKDLLAIADSITDDEWWSQAQIWRTVAPTVAPLHLKNGENAVYNAAHFNDVPQRRMRGETTGAKKGKFYEPVPLLKWLESEWERNAGRMPLDKRDTRLARVREILLDPPTDPIDLPGLVELFAPIGLTRGNLASTFKRYTGEPVTPPAITYRNDVVCWPARAAILAFADRIMWRYREEPGAGHGEQTVTTREMISEGLLADGGQANWSILKPEPIEGEHKDLPLDPWVLGAWLADGSKTGGQFASDPNNGDLDYVEERLHRAGFETHRTPGTPTSTFVSGFAKTLRKVGVYDDKHIPEEYFSADIEQRLELARGLLDQDGTLDENGSIEFTQSADHATIIEGTIRLLRSLGIIVHKASRNTAGYTDGYGNYFDTQDRLRLTFTTDMPVFSLPRKRAKLPTELRETQKWLYVKDIKPIPDEPHRCLSIASPDHTYLVGGYVPTHNTRLGLHLAAQWGQLPDPDSPRRNIPVIFSDPKPQSSDFEPFVRRHGGTVYKLDRPDAKGILDPFRCIPYDMKDMLVQTATAMLSQIISGRTDDRKTEIAIATIVGFGWRNHAGSMGEAMDMSWNHYRNGNANDLISPMIEQIKPDLDRMLENDALMPLIYGVGHDGPRLSVSEGLTLLSAGKLNIIGEKGVDTATSAVQRWVCRMTAVGASSLIIGRNGVLIVDEAWSLLLDDYGKNLVNRMGRLARDQHYSVCMLSQKAKEFVDAGIQSFIGKVYVLAIGGRNEGAGRGSEAEAACQLANQPVDGRMHERMMHDRYIDPDSRAPDYESLYALKDPKTGRLLRGSIAYFQVGDAASAIPVEIRVDPKLG